MTDQVRRYMRGMGLALLFAITGLGSSLGLRAQERRGTLANGLSYILRRNDIPRQKFEARLVMRFGSSVQRPDEAGYAHFIEHLAFGGSKHFPGQSAIRYAESLGARYGIGINAVTGEDRTVYMLSLPTDEPKVLDSTFVLIGDWISELTLGGKALDRERNVIKEEIRAYDQTDPFYQLKVGIGKHAQGIPIGTPRDIDTATAKGLRSFYQRWYRPSHAVVIIVGDIDLNATERQLRRQLGKLPKRTKILGEEEELSYAPGLRLERLEDSLAREATLDIIFPHRTPPTHSLRAIYEDRLQRMALSVWSNRTDQLPGTKLTDNWYLGRTNHLALTLQGERTDSLLARYEHAVGALRHLVNKGVTPEELDEVRGRVLSGLYLVGDGTSSASWCDYYLDEALHGDYILQRPQDMAWLRKQLRAVSPRDLRLPLVRLLMQLEQGARIASFTYNPTQPEQTPPSASLLTSTLRRGLQQGYAELAYLPRKSAEPEDEPVPTPELLQRPKHLPAPRLAQRRSYPALGVEEAYLTNGMRILLRPVRGSDSTVKVVLDHPVGLRQIPDSLQTRLGSLAAYLELGGIERLERPVLDAFTYQRGLSMTLSEAMDWGGIYGASPTKETYALLSLLREKMLRPERSYRDFEESKESLRASLGRVSHLEQALKRQPERMMQRRLDSLLGLFVPLREPATMDEVEALNLDSLAKYHTDLWRRTQSLTLVATGVMNVDEMLREISAVFGDMPAVEARPTQYAEQPRIEEKVYTMETENSGDEALLQHVYYGSYEPSLRGSLRLKFMRELLRNRLIERLRSEAGIIYSPYLYLEYRPKPEPFAFIRLETTLKPENAPLACKLISELAEDLKEHPASAQEVADIRRTFLINKREALTETNTTEWMNLLLQLLHSGETLDDFARYDEIVRSITPEEIRAEFAKFLSPDHLLIYSIVPKQ